MTPTLAPGFLSWDEVDPSRHPFDRTSADSMVRSLGPAQRVPSRPDVPVLDPAMTAWIRDQAKPWADAMSHELVEHLGRWSLGWRWAHAEGDFDGGPVGNWCCPRHSVTTPEETLSRVSAALCEWRGWLEDLAAWFESYPLDLAAVEDQRILWERTARKLILHVSDRTGADSGWHGHCRQVLTWFLTRWEVAPEAAQALIDQAIGGRFRSWTSPETVLVDDIAERLARSLSPDVASSTAEPSKAEPEVDHLQRWLSVREAVAWSACPSGDPVGPVIAARDGAAEDIRSFDAAIDPERAQGLLRALALARRGAASGAPLDFELLRTWQQHVLNVPQPPNFRTQPAFAKLGAERYGIDPSTRARFDTCLAEATDDATSRALPITARAARAYLDVCFFHPFDDGNARVAFLTLTFILARAGITLDHVTLLRRVAFKADAPQDALTLARFIGIHIEGTRAAAKSPLATASGSY